ncbi:Uncharacterized protein TPAR_03638 [Tolypocladium paradoxum]|uniref:Uncharacterized protein n=1 Tax=Tolypocladium paradoxum TaxID=94208 RepID=A0A2S4L142_9HYPO|nr:Uncharacterized protein TPAR_03638 [Tolypocladium paradoxum]
MASRKPDLRVSMPDREQADADSQRPENAKRSPRSPRSPRFREDFDAPFSEALMNASLTTLATDISGSFVSTHSRNSVDGDGKRHTVAGTMHKTQAQSPGPPQARHESWMSSRSSRRRFSFNDRIREWAKKSFVAFSRKDSEKSEERSFSHHNGRRLTNSVIVNPASDNTNSDTHTSPDKDRQPVVAVTEVKNPR